MDISNIIRPGDDPLAEQPTYTITLSIAEAFAVRDAVACLFTAAQTDRSADEAYGGYADCGFIDEAHAVADRLTLMMRPHAQRAQQQIRMLIEAQQRRN